MGGQWGTYGKVGLLRLTNAMAVVGGPKPNSPVVGALLLHDASLFQRYTIQTSEKFRFCSVEFDTHPLLRSYSL